MAATRSLKKSYANLVIGSQIRHLRRSKDLSQRKLAEKAGVSPGWIGRIERGTHLPNIPLLVKIATALQVRTKDLIPESL
jgi:transcriptional regulator with XRE-family HTH domain